MAGYIIKRLLALIPVLVVATTIVFFALRLFAPVDIVLQSLGETPGAGDPALRQRLMAEFGLDRSPIEQYLVWVARAARGDLGTSWSTGKPVTQNIINALPVTVELAVLATILALLIATPLGIISAVRQNTWVDYGSRFVAVLGISVPNFVVATVLLLGPAMVWGWAPPITYASPWDNPSTHALQIFLPVISLGAVLAATQVRIQRSVMLDILRNDYLRTARAKGLHERSVVYQHALRNALIPVITLVGAQFAVTLGGAVVIEQIFSLPGLGRLTLTAIQRGDFPQLQGDVLYLLIMVLLVNLLVDVSYAWLDPRIRYR
jgi:peptide/nickel transport system permease protein